MMQAGFTCLESGLTRSKNSINVGIKNIADFGLSACLFWAVGFAMMFGDSLAGVIGLSNYVFFSADHNGAWLAAFFLFQLMFCSTAVTIVSGAVAERTRFGGYLLIVLFLSGLIYPVFGHWAWRDNIRYPELAGWLSRMGFVDFAGATVVHSVGGWVALAAVLAVGPRHGRFPPGEPPRNIQGHNLSIAVLGALLLGIGWLGFNGGSTLAVDERIPSIIVKTVLAGAAGMVTAMLISWRVTGRTEVMAVINGILAGLVAITAGCHAVDTSEAVLIGASGAAVMLLFEHVLVRMRIDDAVGAIGVHAGAGTWGTIMTGLLGDPELLATGLSFGAQVGVQILGASVCFVWAFGMASLFFWIVGRFASLRVSPEQEQDGLNVSEHGATTEIYDLYRAMEDQAATGDLGRRAPVEPFTEVGQIAARYNKVLSVAESASKAKSDFLATMSHEIRTPIGGVLGMLELLSRSSLSNSQREYAHLAKHSAESLLQLLNDVLDFSKIESGKLELEHTPFALRDVIEDALQTMSIRSAEKNLELVQIVAADVPNGLIGDPTRLRQILLNLIGNAVKFTESGEIVVIVCLDAENEEQVNLQFQVRDTGIGISLEKQPNIFEEFRQADAETTRKYGGTGLGLSICRQLVEAMHGQIRLQSAPGEGSTFTFTAKFGRAAIGESERPNAPQALAGREVLIVDENAACRAHVAELFTHWRMKPTTVVDADAALESISDHSFELAVLDATGTEADVSRIADRLRDSSRLKKTPILITSYAVGIDVDERCAAIGADRVLKPVRETALLAAVVEALGFASIDAQSTEKPQPTTPARILLVEDGAINQKVAVELLQQDGHTVVIAENGEQALVQFQAKSFDIVLMDVEMPVMDGIEATKRIRSSEAKGTHHVPIVATSASSSPGDRERFLAAGMDDSLPKPFRAATLREIVAKWSAQSRTDAPTVKFATDDSTIKLLPDAALVADALDLNAARGRIPGDDDFLREIAGLAIQELPTRTTAMRTAMATGDVETVRREAHTIKNTAHVLGAAPVHQAAVTIEMQAREGSLDDTSEALVQFESKMGRLTEALKTIVGT